MVHAKARGLHKGLPFIVFGLEPDLFHPSVRVGFETFPSRTQRSAVNSQQLSLYLFVYFPQMSVVSLLFELFLCVIPQRCFVIHSGIVTGQIQLAVGTDKEGVQ